MKHNEKNIIVKNVFSDNEIEQIKNSVNNSSGSAFIEPHCQLNNFIKLPENIILKITNYAREISGNNNLVLTEYCHAIYKNTKKNERIYRPSLFPHYDETFLEPRFTFDYQLDANIDWPLVVAPDTEFVLENNQALTFSGTHQIHWRKPTIFNDDQYVQMIFCHLSDPNTTTKDDNVNKFMDSEATKYLEIFYNSGGFSNI